MQVLWLSCILAWHGMRLCSLLVRGALPGTAFVLRCAQCLAARCSHRPLGRSPSSLDSQTHLMAVHAVNIDSWSRVRAGACLQRADRGLHGPRQHVQLLLRGHANKPCALRVPDQASALQRADRAGAHAAAGGPAHARTERPPSGAGCQKGQRICCRVHAGGSR